MLPLALTGQEWIAVAGLTSGVVVGLGGLVFSYFNGRAERAHAEDLARAERAHAEELARAARLHEQRQSAYEELGIFLERGRLRIEREARGPEFPFTPPAFPRDDEWTELLARAHVRGSAAVRAMFAHYREVEEDFYREVGYLETLTEREAILEQRQSVEETRRIALEAIDDAEKAIRDELATL